MQNRQNALEQWLQKILGQSNVILTPLTGDASFRRYYRLQQPDKHYIVMDAPPEKEPLKPFLDVGALLQQHQVLTPAIHGLDVQQGFVLLDDFGDTLLLDQLRTSHATPELAEPLYVAALNRLIPMQKINLNEHQFLPRFDQTFMQSELSVFQTWFLDAYLKLQLTPAETTLIQDTFVWLTDEISQQPQVLIHRDFHSRNIMVLENSISATQYPATENNDSSPAHPPQCGTFSPSPGRREKQQQLFGSPNLGIIDFQDAMQGPMTYDLVSLLKDCYIQWPSEYVIRWLTLFYHSSSVAQQLSLPQFKRAFDLCGLQRHLKVLGVFCRLFLRDNKANYLKDLPLTRHYVMACLETYPELQPFYHFMDQRCQLPK